MGCDGGTIPTRDELVKTRKKPEQKDKDSERLYKWQHCCLTQEPLRKPIAACELGRFYNKEAIIEKLIDKSSDKVKSIQHINGLKDIKELDLTPNPSFNSKKSSLGDGFVDRSVAPWICPVTGLEMNGRFKFVMDWSNGKVLSERAYKMLKDDHQSRILEEHVVVLNPEGEDIDRMETKMDARRARAMAEKKAKKAAAKRKVEAEDTDFKAPAPIAGTSSNNGTSKDVAKVAVNGKKAKTSSHSKTDDKSKIKSSSGAKNGVQNDPTKSEVFKSLFASHKSAQNRPKGNWVTFDPRYN